jgi:hypothetical protein
MDAAARARVHNMIPADLETDARNAGRDWAMKLPVPKIIDSYNDCHKNPDPDLPSGLSVAVEHDVSREAWVHHFWQECCLRSK